MLTATCPWHGDQRLETWPAGHALGWGPTPAQTRTAYAVCTAQGCQFCLEVGPQEAQPTVGQDPVRAGEAVFWNAFPAQFNFVWMAPVDSRSDP